MVRQEALVFFTLEQRLRSALEGKAELQRGLDTLGNELQLATGGWAEPEARKLKRGKKGHNFIWTSQIAANLKPENDSR